MAELWYITIGDGWMLDYATEAFGMNPVPWVHSISYGWPELFNCQQEVTHAHCSGITDLQYTNRANTEFMKLTSRGVSVIVCSQDEGAPSEQNEYCQLDSSQPIWSIYPADAHGLPLFLEQLLLMDHLTLNKVLLPFHQFAMQDIHAHKDI